MSDGERVLYDLMRSQWDRAMWTMRRVNRLPPDFLLRLYRIKGRSLNRWSQP
jgi:hypothetical protein